MKRCIYSQLSNLRMASSCAAIGSVQIKCIPADDRCRHELFRDAMKPIFGHSPLLVEGFHGSSFKDVSSRWRDLEYLKETVGPSRLVEVEIGGSYSSGNVERPEIPFDEFINYMELFEEKYGRLGNSSFQKDDEIVTQELVYLAQNDISNFPNLMKDVEFPDIIRTSSDNIGQGQLYNMMLWFGPRSCVSPLHFDPLDNLLMQYVGRKRVYLLPKSTRDEVNWHYAGVEGQQYNTSPIDVTCPDLNRYPMFQHAPKVLHADLNEGDILYIPAKWWHQVISIDRSISVNAWWR